MTASTRGRLSPRPCSDTLLPKGSVHHAGTRTALPAGNSAMTTRVAINGLGRIGRAILKLVMDEPSLELVAVNDLVDVDTHAYLLRFDTVYGRYAKPVT